MAMSLHVVVKLFFVCFHPLNNPVSVWELTEMFEDDISAGDAAIAHRCGFARLASTNKSLAFCLQLSSLVNEQRF